MVSCENCFCDSCLSNMVYYVRSNRSIDGPRNAEDRYQLTADSMQLGGNWAIHHRQDTWAHPMTHNPILDDHVTSFTARHVRLSRPPRLPLLFPTILSSRLTQYCRRSILGGEGLLPVPSVRSSRLGECVNSSSRGRSPGIRMT